MTREEMILSMAESDLASARRNLVENLDWSIRQLQRAKERLETEDSVEAFLPSNINQNLAPKHSDFLVAQARVSAVRATVNSLKEGRE